MKDRGIVLRGPDEVIESRARRAKLEVIIKDGYGVPFDKTLIVDPGTRVPWDLLPAAWHFLDRWDAAVPLWKYGMTAADVGTDEDRRQTAEIVRDLRVLLHSVELLFVRKNEVGAHLMYEWAAQVEAGGDRRLAFLRAMYLVKPKLCVLPTTWLVGVRGSGTGNQGWRRGRAVPTNGGKPLVQLEVEPGRIVKVHAGDEEKTLARFEQQKRGVNMAVVDSQSFDVVNQEINMKKGPLVKVELQPGRFVKMYEADAIAQGLIEAKSKPASKDKASPPSKDKMRKPAGDKAASESGSPEEKAEKSETPERNEVSDRVIADPQDDFTTIDGVGPATARALAANDINTFDELRAAGELEYLTGPINEAIERWRGLFLDYPTVDDGPPTAEEG